MTLSQNLRYYHVWVCGKGSRESSTQVPGFSMSAWAGMGLGDRHWGLTLVLYCPKHSAAEPSSLLAFGLWYDHCIFMPVSCATETKFFGCKPLDNPGSGAEKLKAGWWGRDYWGRETGRVNWELQVTWDEVTQTFHTDQPEFPMGILCPFSAVLFPGGFYLTF